MSKAFIISIFASVTLLMSVSTMNAIRILLAFADCSGGCN
jgi:hypothetical protein